VGPDTADGVQLYSGFRTTLRASDIGSQLLNRRLCFAANGGKSQLHFGTPFFIWPSLVWWKGTVLGMLLHAE
jgi:hypothetical protein